MGDLVSDASVADELATSLTDIDLSGAVPVPYATNMNVGAATSAASLGNSLKGIFENLNSLIDSKAENLREVAEIMTQADATLAQGIR